MNQNSNIEKLHSLTVATMSYQRSEDQRILAAVLSNWFRSPKDLHFTDPRVPYPFNMKKWIKLTYQYPGATTFVCKKEKWIIAHASVKPRRPGHFTLFHFIVDGQYRGQGIGAWFLDQILELLIKEKVRTVSLRVSRKNTVALQLYHSRGFQTVATSGDNLTMEKTVSTGE